MEELFDRLERPIYYRVQMHAPNHHSGSYCRPAAMDLACVLWCAPVEQLPQHPAVIVSLQRQCQGISFLVDFTANDNQYHMVYYLADDIYLTWSVFVRTISCSIEPKRIYFAQRQEAARKDVEWAFYVLQARWALVNGPTRFFYKGDITDIIYAAIVLHNMIVEDEGEEVANVPVEPTVGPSHGVASESHPSGCPSRLRRLSSRIC